MELARLRVLAGRGDERADDDLGGGRRALVVIGTTRDPATPYEWAVRLRDQLAKASLITFDGDGHTAYTRSNSCVDQAVDAYYLEGDPAARRPALLSPRRRRAGLRRDPGRLVYSSGAPEPAGARRLSSVGQSDSLVMNRSRVRFP